MTARIIILILLAILYLITYLTDKTAGRGDTRAYLTIFLNRLFGWIFVIIAIIFLLDLIIYLITKI